MATENVLLCKCKNVTLADIEKALRESERLSDAVLAFEDVQRATHCSTGCGQCHGKIMQVISDLIYDIV